MTDATITDERHAHILRVHAVEGRTVTCDSANTLPTTSEGDE